MDNWQLPTDWEWKALPEICEINPKRPRLQRADDVPTSFVPMQAVDDIDGKITVMETRKYEEVKRGYTYFEENDVLMAKITPSMENGKAAIAQNLIDGIGFGTTEFHVFRPREGILPAWIFYFVRRLSFRLEAKSHFRGAVGQQRVPEDFLKSYEIPIPFPNDPARSLETQKRIILRLETLLGEVKSARELQESIEEETNLLIDSVLTEIFASRDQWQNEKPLDELVSIEASLVDPRRPEYSKLPHIYGASIEGGTGRLLDYQSAAEDGMTSNKYLFEPGVVLYSKIRPYLRKVTIADFKGVCSADMYPLTVTSDEILPEFLMWTLLSLEFTEFINAFSLRARIPKVNREQLMAYRMRYPDINSQKKIAAYIQNWRDEVGEMQRAQRENSALLEQAEQALLAQAFRGEL